MNVLYPFVFNAIDQLLNDPMCELLPQNESLNFSLDLLKGENYLGSLDKLLKNIDLVQFKDGKIVTYRALGHDLEGDDIFLKQLGVCWSWNIKKAYCYRAENKENHYFMYHGLCEPTSVNWVHTVQKRLSLWGHEQELKMIPSAPIEVIKIERRQKTLETILETWDVQYPAMI